MRTFVIRYRLRPNGPTWTAVDHDGSILRFTTIRKAVVYLEHCAVNWLTPDTAEVHIIPE